LFGIHTTESRKALGRLDKDAASGGDENQHALLIGGRDQAKAQRDFIFLSTMRHVDRPSCRP
jgi:hypothetical protein